MSSFAAASLVIGILLLVGGPILYWVVFKMDSGPRIEPAPDGSIKPQTKEEIEKIESKLGVTLPLSYKEFLMSPKHHTVDDATALTDFSIIIAATIEYRRGFENLTPWPSSHIYLGDEADASPYILDTLTGTVMRHPKGEITKPPFEKYESFDKLLDSKT